MIVDDPIPPGILILGIIVGVGIVPKIPDIIRLFIFPSSLLPLPRFPILP